MVCEEHPNASTPLDLRGVVSMRPRDDASELVGREHLRGCTEALQSSVVEPMKSGSFGVIVDEA
jgi:hypothetical protein